MLVSFIIDGLKKTMWTDIHKAWIAAEELEKQGKAFRIGSTMDNLPTNDPNWLKNNLILG